MLKKFQSISAFTILLFIILLLAGLTWFIPSVENASFALIVMAPYEGFVNAIDVCIFILVLGGFLGVVTKSGALERGIQALVNKLNGKELYLIPLLMILFAIGGTTFGMAEESIGFYALVSATMVAAGFDTLVAAATILLGAGVGCIGSTINPFAVGIASDALINLGYDVNQGIIIGLGLLITLLNLAITIYFVMRYAKQVQSGNGSILSAKEIVAMKEEYPKSKKKNDLKLNYKQKLVLSLFAVSFLIMVVAVIPWKSFLSDDLYRALFNWTSLLNGLRFGEWWFGELSMWFFVMAILIGILANLKESEIVKSFVSGASDMVSVVLIIALARGAAVIMATTGLDLYILNIASAYLKDLPAIVFAPLSYLLYLALSFLVPSSSALATATMPIMGSLTSEIGYNPAVMISLFASANGIINLFTPTSAVVMGGLQIARVDYATWLKFSGKVIIICALSTMIVLVGAMIIL